MKYDVYPNSDSPGYLLDIQTDLLGMLNTRVVVPLVPRDQAPLPAKRLNPVFEIAGSEFVMMTQYLSAVPSSSLGNSATSLESNFSEITDAVDMLTQGF